MTSRADPPADAGVAAPRRIGGEFELAAADFACTANDLAGPPGLGAPHEAWLDTGRSALALIARDLARQSPRALVWLPAYACESVFAPFLRAGLAVRPYATGEDLQGLPHPRDGDAVLFIHYFGRRHDAAISATPEWRARGVRVIEDCVQAPFTAGAGQHGDHAITSLRKVLAVPDGALLASRRPLDATALPPDEAFIASRTAAKWLRGPGGNSSAFLPLVAESEARLDNAAPRTMSWTASHLLRRLDVQAVARQRRHNHAVLAEGLATLVDAGALRPLLGALRDGEVPLGLPVVVAGDRRDALRRYLAGQEIFCPVHWDLPQLPVDGFDLERQLSARMLTLPLDQRYDDHDMHRLLDALRHFFIPSATFPGARP